jgi:6-phosphogluconolactonase
LVTQKKPGQYFSIALSGGSTPMAIFTILAERYRDRIDWSKLAFFWGDERCVPPSDPESNYRMTNENLFSRLSYPELNFCRIQGEDDPAAEAARYSGRVDSMLPHANGLPQFDLVMLGLGEDGHTASIFPHNIGLFNSDRLFEPSTHPVSGQIRITATGKLINNAREVWFIATGAGKAEKVAQVIRKQEGWEKLPASLVRPASGKLVWLLDEAAAAGL